MAQRSNGDAAATADGDRSGDRAGGLRGRAGARDGGPPLWPPPVAALIGFEVIAVEPGRAVVALDAGPQHANPLGTVHGGILCDIADAAMGVAYASTLGTGETFTTVELKINFLRPVRAERLTARGRVVKGGRTLGLVECDVVDARDRLVARASSTCMTLRGERAGAG